MDSYLLAEFRRQADAHRAPAYQHLRRALQHAIEHGVLGFGQALPPERELATLMDLSRVTVRKAIAGLVEEGLLTQRHGAGTCIAERIVKPMSRLSSFTEDLRDRGLHPRSEFFERSIGEVTPEEAMAMNLSPGAHSATGSVPVFRYLVAHIFLLL